MTATPAILPRALRTWLARGLTMGFLLSVSVACGGLLGIDGSYDDAMPSGDAGTGDEVCDNGQDDDGDGQADCADPQCGAVGYHCAPPVPDGWQGPVIWSETCSGAWSQLVMAGGEIFDASQGTCPTCSCGPPTDVLCAMNVTLFDGAGCAGQTLPYELEVYGGCTNHGVPFEPLSVRVDSDMLVGSGKCTPSKAGAQQLEPPRWEPQVSLCGRPTTVTGCKGGQVCVPPSTGDGGVCIMQEGQRDCPANFSVRRVLYQNLTDQRSCTECACGTPINVCTGAVLQLAVPGTSCAQVTAPLAKGECRDLTLSPNFGGVSVFSIEPDSSGGSCSPIPSELTGSALREDPVTACCTEG